MFLHEIFHMKNKWKRNDEVKCKNKPNFYPAGKITFKVCKNTTKYDLTKN